MGRRRRSGTGEERRARDLGRCGLGHASLDLLIGPSRASCASNRFDPQHSPRGARCVLLALRRNASAPATLALLAARIPEHSAVSAGGLRQMEDVEIKVTFKGKKAK